MKPPKNTKEVREFIEIVNYYRYMWSKRSHLLYPLTALTSNKVKFKWTDAEQNCFDDNKHDVSQDTLLTYLYFNERFIICADDIDYYLGELIIHNANPLLSTATN